MVSDDVNHVIMIISASCKSTQKVSYVKVSHSDQSLFGDAQLIVHNQTLTSCLYLCTVNSGGTINGIRSCAGLLII